MTDAEKELLEAAMGLRLPEDQAAWLGVEDRTRFEKARRALARQRLHSDPNWRERAKIAYWEREHAERDWKIWRERIAACGGGSLGEFEVWAKANESKLSSFAHRELEQRKEKN